MLEQGLGDNQTVTITGYGSNGEGVARLDDGRVVFVRNAARGDVLQIKLTKTGARSARAEITGIITPSPYRIEPDCPHYPECGGCDFRHVTYEEELEAKLNRVNDAMRRIGGLDIHAEQILSTGQTEEYRNKAVFHSDGKSLGFYRSGSHDIVPIDRCLLLKEDINAAIKTLPPVSHKEETTLRSGLNGLAEPFEEELDGLRFMIQGFFQVNKGAALLLYKKVREYAGLSKTETLIDLYCGVGAMTLFAGRNAGRALGVEQNAEAVIAARENALRNGFPHIEFINADAAAWEAGSCNPDCVIVDPPRNGLSTGVVSKILELAPKRIVYASCDPATLARDLKALHGYEVNEICAVDMFPRTANVECCCLLKQVTKRMPLQDSYRYQQLT